MASVYMSEDMNDTRLRLCRPTYQWPESEAKFVKMVTSSNNGRVITTSRQMYLRSYTFSRKEERSVKDKTFKCLGSLKQRLVCATQTHVSSNLKVVRFRIEFLMITFSRAKDASRAAFFSVFHPLLSCASNKVN